MSDNLAAALWYLKKGYAVIPVGTDKKPIIKWQKYQEQMPTEDEVKTWFTGRDVNIGIVTGKISNLTVLDIDTKEGLDAIEELWPDALITPMVSTPRGGQHRYFKYHPNIRNCAGFIPGCDIRSEGGYIVSPPSIGENSKPYAWIQHISNHPLQDIPEKILSRIPFNNINALNIGREDSFSIGENVMNVLDNRNNSQQSQHFVTFKKGKRDQDLFHVANYLSKGGMQQAEISIIISILATQICDPPFPIQEAQAKVKSAIERSDRKNINLFEELKRWISVTNDNFSVTEAQHDITNRNIGTERAVLRVYLDRLVKEGKIERIQGQRGVFRKVEDTIWDTWEDSGIDPVHFNLPLGLGDYVELYPGDIFVYAGSKSTGKSALALETIRLNLQGAMGIYYHSSEITAPVFKKRISNCDKTPFPEWKARVKLSTGLNYANAADRVQPGGFNVFDYIQVPDGEYYKMGYAINRVHEKLDGGIALVCLQKNPNSDFARGGWATMDKPNLYCLLDKVKPVGNKLRVADCKAFRGNENPSGWEVTYKIHKGINIEQTSTLMPAWEK